MNTDIDFNRGILYIRLFGSFIKREVNNFESLVIPIILGLNQKYVTVNLANVDMFDRKGVNSLIKISDVVNRFNGKVVLCELNYHIKDYLKNSDIFDYCFKSKNEKTSLGVFKI